MFLNSNKAEVHELVIIIRFEELYGCKVLQYVSFITFLRIKDAKKRNGGKS